MAAAGGKFLALKRLQNNPVLQLAFNSAGDRDSYMGNAANKIGSAIQRVDNPLHIGIGIAAGTTFLTDKAVIRVGFLDVVDNSFF